MGLRFRKSFKIAPGVKLNLNKNSSSVTFGKRGAHYTVNSKGKKTASVGIPGTGISYTQSTGGNTSSKKSTNQGGPNMSQNNFPDYNGNNKKWYQKTGWIIALLILFFPVGLFLMWKYTNWKKPVKGVVTALILIIAVMGVSGEETLDKITLTADTDTTYDINQKVKITASTTPDDYSLSKDDFQCSDGKLKVSDKNIIFTTSQAGSYTIWAEHDGIKSNKLTINVEDKAAIAKKDAEEKAQKEAEEKAKKEAEEKAAQEAAAAQAQAEAEAQAAAQAQAQAEAQQQAQAATQAQQNNDPTVYITNTGGKYHRAGCRFLKQSQIEKHLSEVKGVYGPCGVCNPPQ